MSEDTSAPSDPQRELQILTTKLSPESERILRDVVDGRYVRCVDEITTFALEKVFAIQSVSHYGQRDDDASGGHYFIDSQSTTTELKRFERFARARDLCRDPAERASKTFEFTYTAVRSSLATLQNALRARNIRTIYEAPLLDALYFPLLDTPLFEGDQSTHCTMLIYIVRRQELVLFDSLAPSGHQKIARSIAAMLIATRLVEPQKLNLRLPIAPQQHGVTECGWCAIIFAVWWRVATPETDVRDVINVTISHADIVGVARSILEKQAHCRAVASYADRLQRAFFVLSDRANLVQRTKQAKKTT